MIKINYTIINLDINKNIYDKLIAKQGDVKSRYLLFNLNINGAAIDLTNKNVRVYAIKPDGNEVFNDLTISNAKQGSCILELTTQILAICGIVKMELVITEGQKKLSSFEFELEVIKSLNRETSIVSTNEFTALINALAALNEYDNYKNEIKNARGNKQVLAERLDEIEVNVNDIKTKSKYSTSVGSSMSSNVLDLAYIHIGGTNLPHGVFIVTIRDTTLGQYYVGIHNYSKDTFHNATKIAGELAVNTNNVGTIITTTGNISNQEYTIELISNLS